MGTRTNPIPNGEQWVTVSADGPDECCGFRAKSNCFVCCAPFSFLPPFSETSENLEYVAEKPLEDGLAITRGAVAPGRGTGARSGLPPAREKQTGERRPPPFYMNLRGQLGLVKDDPQWAALERGEVRAFTSSSLTSLTRKAACFTAEGFSVGGVNADGSVTHEPVDSDLIRIDSAEADELGMHEVLYGSTREVAQLPMNALLELQEVLAPGEWEAPNGTFPPRKLYVLTATYRPPRARGGGGSRARTS